jgi:hypothetical protein
MERENAMALTLREAEMQIQAVALTSALEYEPAQLVAAYRKARARKDEVSAAIFHLAILFVERGVPVGIA